MESEDRLRLDKWLVHARFCKTRAIAAQMIAKKRVRVNRVVAKQPSHPVRVGDVLTLPRGYDVAVVRVECLGTRRGPASEARTLYDELSPAN